MRSASGRSAACLSGGSRDGKRDILGSLSKSELGMRTYSTTDDGNALISGGGCETLALGFVEDDGGGDGGVEGFDGAGHGNGESGVGGALNFGGEAGAFVADEEGEGGAEVGGVGGGRGGFGGGGDEREAGGAELGESNRWREAAEEREAEGGASGGAHGFGGPGVGGAFGGDHAGGAEGLSGADGCADVAGVLDAEQGDDEREATSEVVESAFAGFHESGDALGMFGGGDLVEEFFGGAEDVKGFALGRSEGVEEFVGGGGGEAFGDVKAGAKGFFDEMRAFDSEEIFFRQIAVAEGGAEGFKVLVIAGGDERFRAPRTKRAWGSGSRQFVRGESHREERNKGIFARKVNAAIIRESC